MTTLPVLGPLLTGPPWLLAVVLLVVTPGVHLVLSRCVERRPVTWTDDYPAVLVGDPALALAAGLSIWVADGQLASVADWRWGLVALLGGAVFGAFQSRLELAEGRYTPEQIVSPSKRFHQYGVYPVLGYLVPAAVASGGANWGNRPVAAAGILGLLMLWLLLVFEAIRNPRVGHGTLPRRVHNEP